jgi:putative protease
MNNNFNTIELLAPARDYDCARAAILCGADAVYIGAPQFSARAAAGNSLDDIRRVVGLAHVYFVRVYVALNTILTDEELAAAKELIEQLYEIGIDGLIVQDMGLLEMELPPIPIIASTQTNNASIEKVKFLEEVGFSRVILARELTVDQIAAIRAGTSVELECFVHGALCVGASGQCYMSYALGGRSGNRGECAQPCRRRYTLKDSTGKVVSTDRYLLSLKDLNLSANLAELLDAGATSFKIEGRLKDAGYVANIVGFYRQKLDAILAERGLRKSSSGSVSLNFSPEPNKTFNRGFTGYGVTGRGPKMGSIDTPKSMGEPVGTIAEIGKDWFTLAGDMELHNGDGVCFFDAYGELCGTVINRVENGRAVPQKMDGLKAGVELYRNYDHVFAKQLKTPSGRGRLRCR